MHYGRTPTQKWLSPALQSWPIQFIDAAELLLSLIHPWSERFRKKVKKRLTVLFA